MDLNLEPGAESRLKYGHLWFQQSTRFKCPKGNFCISLIRIVYTENSIFHHFVNSNSLKWILLKFRFFYVMGLCS